MKRAALHSLGCKVNSYETEAMRQSLEEAGYEIVPFHEEADLYVINTCSVTNIADRKSRQMIHRARKQNPDAIVAAAGCYVQISADQAVRDAAIDIVIGNDRKKELVAAVEEFERCRRSRKLSVQEIPDSLVQEIPEHEIPYSLVQEIPEHEIPVSLAQEIPEHEIPDSFVQKTPEHEIREPSGQKVVFVDDISRPGQPYEEMRVSRPAEHTRAFLKVQDGCNQFCSYCIIPYARGRVRSRRTEDVRAEAEELAKNGFQEIVLTGIHLSSYGTDLGCTLLDLIRELHEVKGIRRIRLGSLEPGIITEDFVRALASMNKICPHFHLSLQSGSDTVLKRMNRKYTTEEYFHKCGLLRKYYEHPALTTDIIVGFPGETEEEFAATCAFARKVSFYEIHVFQYSRREGTAAARMSGQLPQRVKAERSRILLDISKEMKERFVSWYTGRPVEVLFEEPVTENGEKFYEGFTPEYVKVRFCTEESLRNRIMVVEFFPHFV